MTRRRAIAPMLLAATLALLAMPAMAAGYRHHLAAAVGQPVERSRQPRQALPSAAPAFRRHLIHQDGRRLEITHRLDRHHLVATHPVGHEMARGGEQEGLGLARQLARGGLVHPRVDLLAQVGDLVALRPAADQETHQRRLVDEDLAYEPVVQRWRGHGRHHIRSRRGGDCRQGEIAPRFVSIAQGPDAADRTSR